MAVPDFVIVGGGIGGSVLAELLARAGKRALVLEKSTSPPPWTRPEILWPATAEFLSEILSREVWERGAALPLEGVDLHDGRRLRPLLSPEILQLAGARPWSADPNRLRELLVARASFEIRRGVEVVGLLREGTGVSGVRARELATGREVAVPARCTVADDGAHSVVREMLGIRIDLRTFALDLLCFGLDWPDGLPRSRARLWANRGAVASSGILALGAVPVPGRRGTAIVALRRGAVESGRAARGWDRFVGRDRLLAEILAGRRLPEPGGAGDLAIVRRPFGHAESYGKDGVVLIGDAAHPVSPTGGQGSSMAIADARALARLALAGSHDLARDLERVRREANERSLGLTRVADRLWRVPTWCLPAPLVSVILALLGSRPALLARAVRDVSTRFLDERDGQEASASGLAT